MTDRTELYRHFDADGKLLYVGISLSAVARLSAHRHASHWFDRITSVTIQRFDTRQDALKAEYRAIQDEKPECNLDHTSMSMKGKAIPKPYTPSEPLLTLTETSIKLRVGSATLRRYVSNGMPLKPVPWNGPMMFRPSDVEAFLNGGTPDPNPRPPQCAAGDA